MGWTWWALGNRPAVFPAVAVLLGVVVGPLAALPWWLWGALAIVALTAVVWRGGRSGSVAAGLVAALSIGALLAELRCDVRAPPIGRLVRFEAEVVRVAPHGVTVDVSAVDGVPTRFRATLAMDDAAAWLVGQRLRGR